MAVRNKLPINQSISLTLYRASPARGKEKSKYITVRPANSNTHAGSVWDQLHNALLW